MFGPRVVAPLAPRLGVRSLITARPGAISALRCRVDRHGTDLHRPAAKARESTSATNPAQADVKDSGHIDVKSNESILFFDNIFPLKLSNILNRQWKADEDLSQLLQRYESSSLGLMDPIRLVKAAIPEDIGMKVTEILPRLKDGGAFVKFKHDSTVDPAKIEDKLTSRLDKKPLKPWFNPFRGIKARLVRGTPWLEDLYRYPSSLVKVEFVPPEPGTNPEELSEETLYSLFRKYGKIADIIPQPQDSKTMPRYAYLGFPLMSDAIMARNCMHGFIVSENLGGGKSGTRLRMSYEKRVKPHSIWNWLTSHPRIVVPLIAALVAGISVLIFDPIREFFIKLQIQHSLHFTESRVYKWFKTQTDNLSIGRKRPHQEGLDTVWKHRRDLIDQLRGWLDGSSDTFIIVTGPKGSGKKEMVMKQTLDGRKNVLLIDCRPIIEARSEAGTIKKLAAAVGYRPVFSWANNVSSMIELVVQSTTGVKAGFSETLDSQLNKIFQSTTSALKDVALSKRSKRDNDANLSEDAYLEAHPEQLPVVVIDNFMDKRGDQDMLYEKVAEWAATTVQNNIAHVVFLTNDSSYTKPLAKAMPDRVFRTLSLGDLDPEVARKFVLSRINEDVGNGNKKKTYDDEEKEPRPEPNLSGLEEAIETVGGRLTDLEFLSRRIKAGQSPLQAVDQIVNENATDIVKMFLLGKAGEQDRKWTIQQAWHLIKSLAVNPSLRYNQVLLSPSFASSTSPSAKDGDAALEALANAELISITFRQGRPQSITTGRTLNQAAFSKLLRDKVLRAKMDLAILSENAKVEAKSIEALENELALLGSLPKQPGQTAGRIMYLLTKLETSQKKITDLEAQMGTLKKVLQEEY